MAVPHPVWGAGLALFYFCSPVFRDGEEASYLFCLGWIEHYRGCGFGFLHVLFRICGTVCVWVEIALIVGQIGENGNFI